MKKRTAPNSCRIYPPQVEDKLKEGEESEQ